MGLTRSSLTVCARSIPVLCYLHHSHSQPHPPLKLALLYYSEKPQGSIHETQETNTCEEYRVMMQQFISYPFLILPGLDVT